MKAYDNYIFDLYGTLADIHTEENDPLVWKKLALFYGYYDADYSSEELKERYAAIIAGEESKMKSEKKDDAHEAHPEVQIEEVFQKLFEEKGVKADPTLAVHAGQFFRILSTDYVKLYDGVTDLLEALKKTGKKIYLLSNAQRIFTEYEMHTLGIAKYFDDIFISSTCGVKKPDSRFFQLLIDKYNLDITKSIDWKRWHKRYRRSEECRTRYLLYSFEYFSKAAGRDRHITGWHRKKTEDRAGCRLCVRWNGHGASQGAAAGRIREDYQRRLPSIHSSQFFHKILALTY